MIVGSSLIARERSFWTVYLVSSCLFGVALAQFSIIVQCIGFLIIIVVAMLRAERYGITHPVSWFSVFFFLYTVSYPLLLLTSDSNLSSLGYSIPIGISAYCAFIAPTVFFVPFGIRLPRSTMNPAMLRSLCLVSLFVCFCLILFVLASGISTKREFIDTIRGTLIGLVFPMFSFAALVFSLYALRTAQYRSDGYIRINIFSALGVGTLIVLFIGFGVTGERDYIFRFALFSFILYFSAQYREKYRAYFLIGAALLLYFLLPLSQSAKGFLLAGAANYEGFSVADIFRNEFSSAGRNLHYVISRDITGFNGETFLWDVNRFVGFSENVQSTGSWFNTEVRSWFGDESTSGWGFSLVAEGYINYGTVGPFLLFFVLGSVTALVHSHARKSELKFVYYLSYIPMMIYVIRADLANFLGLGFKVNLAMIMVIWLAHYFTKSPLKVRGS